jgi:lipoic acid synthetase
VIEVLVPDFNGKDEPLQRVLAAGPDVFNHNLETVRTSHAACVASGAKYQLSLDFLARARESASGLDDQEWHYARSRERLDGDYFQAMDDLRRSGPVF